MLRLPLLFALMALVALTAAVPVQASDSAADSSFGAQLLEAGSVTPGSAKLTGASGCLTTTLTARVAGTKIADVVFLLDGRVVKRAKASASAAAMSYQIRINPRQVSRGVHRLVVNVRFQQGSRTKPKTLGLTFKRCPETE